jgi:hypothetical protein
MPFIPHTPESLLPRSDSKNPAATCRGLTSTGRPCRRGLSKSPQSSPSPSPRTASPDGFCWQHKDQAKSTLPQGLPSTTIKERTSIDTLTERLGLLEVEQRKRQKTLPKQDLQPSRSTRKPQPKSNLRLVCCIGEADNGKRAPRPVKNSDLRTKSSMPNKISRPPITRDPSSRTGEFLSLIPPSTAPGTTALLLTEMAKAVSEHDDEGYIYMFWLTPESLPSTPPTEAAPSLLAPPIRQPGQRRTSDILNSFASNIHNSNRKTILLKIGRAQNVQRRLNQWTRQCGYNLSLIRYYPYQSSSLSSTCVNEPPKTPRKVANVHKVERLIHIELNGKRAVSGGKCGACGREHREWFEVEASRDGVRAVDEVVRRWVDWGERAPMI